MTYFSECLQLICKSNEKLRAELFAESHMQPGRWGIWMSIFSNSTFSESHFQQKIYSRHVCEYIQIVIFNSVWSQECIDTIESGLSSCLTLEYPIFYLFKILAPNLNNIISWHLDGPCCQICSLIWSCFSNSRLTMVWIKL